MDLKNVDVSWIVREVPRIEQIISEVDKELRDRGIQNFREIWDSCSLRQHLEWQNNNEKYTKEKWIGA
jgi:hypothetical protein